MWVVVCEVEFGVICAVSCPHVLLAANEQNIIGSSQSDAPIQTVEKKTMAMSTEM